MPSQVVTSKFGTPASATVGTSGRSATRRPPVTASARSRPSRISGSVVERLSAMKSSWPANRSFSAGPLPLYGTWISGVFSRTCSVAPATCIELPLPAEP